MSTLQVKSLFAVGGKVILVIDGSYEIGKMIAAVFVKNGATAGLQLLCDPCYADHKRSPSFRSTSVHVLLRTATRQQPNLQPLDRAPAPIPADISKLSEVECLVKEFSARERASHVLVNNLRWDSIGTAFGRVSLQDEGFSKILILNLQRVFTLTQKFLPLLHAGTIQGGQTGNVFNDPARIISIGSVEGIGVPDRETYAYSAKVGLDHLSRHLAGRLGKEGILSNTIACGEPCEANSQPRCWMLQETTLYYRFPEDVGGTALFLTSRAGAYVNGATILLDGGFLVNTPLCKL